MTAEMQHEADGMALHLAQSTRTKPDEATTTGKISKVRPRAQTIEQVFATVYTVPSLNATPPQERIVLTPRSAEACLRCGVHPETLQLRALDSFSDLKVTDAVQRMRHDAYSVRRHEEMQMVRREKQKVMEVEEHGSGSVTQKAGHARFSTGSTENRSSALVEIERQRLEKVRQRQERELDAMLEFELRRNRLQQEAVEKLDREKRQDEAMERSKLRLAREGAADKRARELTKKAQVDAEEARRKELAMQLATRDRALAEEAARQEKLRRVEAREREEERKIKAEEHRVQTEKLWRAQQVKVQKRLQELELAEKAREETVAQQRAERAVGMEARRREVMQRIRKNLKASKILEAQRKQEIQRKQEASEAARNKQEEEERRLRAVQVQQQVELERKRMQVLEETRRDEARKRQEMMERQDEIDRKIRQKQKYQQHQRTLRCEYRKLQAQLKKDNVERMKRVQEYRRLEVLRKLQDTEARTQHVLDEKESLVNRRKQLAIQTKIQRDFILRTMEEVKITKKWHQASKTIEKVLKKGKGNLGKENLRFPTEISRVERPKSSSDVLGRQTLLPTLSRPTTPIISNSAAFDDHKSKLFLPPQNQTAFKFLKKSRKSLSSASLSGVAAQPYLSPYDRPLNSAKQG